MKINYPITTGLNNFQNMNRVDNKGGNGEKEVSQVYQ